jgi:hypothetical protein
MKEFTSVAELQAHYRAVRSRLPPPVVVAPPPEPEPEPDPLPPAPAPQPWYPAAPAVFPLARMARIICDYYGIERGHLTGPRRVTELVRARQMFCYVCRMIEPQQSWPRIGRHISRDHTTALHGHGKIARLVETDASMALDAAAIISRYNEGIKA